MSTIEAITYPLAVLRIPAGHGETVSYARCVIKGMTNNSLINPTPAEVAVLETETDAYDKAIVAARDGSKAARAKRKAARVKVVTTLKHLLHFVRVAAEARPTPAEAAELIISVGMSIKKVTKRNKAPLRAGHGDISGTVVLDALRVAAVAMYYWQFSLDQESWTSIPQGMKARVVVSGLTPGRVYYFRFQAQTRKGLGDFSQIVSLMVI